MSLKTWKNEFYYSEADIFRKDENGEFPFSVLYALEHSILKWSGLRQENLTKHGLMKKKRSHQIVEVGNDPDNCGMSIYAKNCSLCAMFDPEFCGCSKDCPFLAYLGKTCYDYDEGASFYNAWVYEDNPELMIKALELLKEKILHKYE